MAEDGSGTSDGFPALSNWGIVNKNETTNEMSWDAMGREEVKEQLNDADKSDISAIDILSHYWKSASGNLMMKVTRLHGLGDAAIEDECVKTD